MCKIKFSGADQLNFEEEDGGGGVVMGDFRKKYSDPKRISCTEKIYILYGLQY